MPVAGLGLWPLGYLQAVTPWFDRKLGLALGCANAGIGVGSTFLPMLVIGPIIAAYSWRHAVLAIAALVLFVSWPVVAYCLREPSAADVAARKQRAAAKSFGLPFKQATREPTFWMLNFGFFLLGVTATSLVTQQVPLLARRGLDRRRDDAAANDVRLRPAVRARRRRLRHRSHLRAARADDRVDRRRRGLRPLRAVSGPAATSARS